MELFPFGIINVKVMLTVFFWLKVNVGQKDLCNKALDRNVHKITHFGCCVTYGD